MIGVAGWVDVVGVLQLLQNLSVFPSFMSGNTTQVFTSLVRGDNRDALLYGSVISVFVLGALLGRLLNDGSSLREAAALFGEALLLAAALLTVELGMTEGATLLVLALAMGWNNVALRASRRFGPKTYVSGALVSVGSDLADALSGRSSWSKLRAPLLTWLSLALGGFLGGLFSETSLVSAALLVPAALLALIGLGVATSLVKSDDENSS